MTCPYHQVHGRLASLGIFSFLRKWRRRRVRALASARLNLLSLLVPSFYSKRSSCFSLENQCRSKSGSYHIVSRTVKEEGESKESHEKRKQREKQARQGRDGRRSSIARGYARERERDKASQGEWGGLGCRKGREKAETCRTDVSRRTSKKEERTSKRETRKE